MRGIRLQRPESWLARRPTPILLRLLCNPMRCHVACGALTVTLLAVLSWVWIHPERLSADHLHSSEQIEDAIALISNRNQLNQRFEQADAHRRSIQARIDHIARWLPVQRSWDTVRSNLQTIAAASDVKLVALEKVNSHEGDRIAVFDARCEIQGSYANICQFLIQLRGHDVPIWCDEIQIVRAADAMPTTLTFASDQPSNPCLATVSLRIPFAGKETVAAKLLQRTTAHET